MKAMRVRWSVVTAGLALMITACVTPYQKAGIPGGYAEKGMGKNVWPISFGGNGFTTPETVQTFWLYRCAEVALEKGFTGFEILSDVRFSMSVAPERLFGESPDQPTFRQSQTIVVPVDSGSKPVIEADVLMLSGIVEHKPPELFDAKIIKGALEPYVKPTGKPDGKNVAPHIHEYLYPGKLPAKTA